MRFLRLTLRDLLWLVVVIAISLGWWVDHRELKEQRDAMFLGNDVLFTNWPGGAGKIPKEVLEEYVKHVQRLPEWPGRRD